MSMWVGWFLITFCVIAGLIWRFSPLYQRFGAEALMDAAQSLSGHPWTPLAVIGIYAVGGLVLFVHVILLWTTVFVFDPWHALLYTELGTFASGITVYWIGRLVQPDLARRIAGSYLEKVSLALGRKGKQTLILLHWFPICPFSLLNFIAGAAHISFRDFLIGTLIGCTPGLLILSFYGSAVRHLAQGHHWMKSIPLILIGAVLCALFWMLRKKFKKESQG